MIHDTHKTTTFHDNVRLKRQNANISPPLVIQLLLHLFAGPVRETEEKYYKVHVILEAYNILGFCDEAEAEAEEEGGGGGEEKVSFNCKWN